MVTKAGPVEDGFGYIKKSIVDKFARKERISLGKSRDNWTWWQRIPWEQVEAECLPLITKPASTPQTQPRCCSTSPHSFEQKKALYDIDMAMIEHPFVAACLNRASRGLLDAPGYLSQSGWRVPHGRADDCSDRLLAWA